MFFCELASSRARLRTPADADEHPLAQLVGGVREHDGGVEVASFAKHPEEVGGVEIVKGSRHQPTPHLQNKTHTHAFKSLDWFTASTAACVLKCRVWVGKLTDGLK